MGTLLGLALLVLGAANHHIVTVLHEVVDALLEIEQAGTTVYQSDAVHRKVALEGRHLEEFVEHHIGVGIALDVNHDAHTLAVGLVVDITDAYQFLLVYQSCNVLNQLSLVNSVRNFGHDDGRVIGRLLNLGLGAHHHPALTGLVSFLHAAQTENISARGEVGRRHILHQSLDVNLGIVDISHRGVDDFGQVVSGNVGGHTDGDTARTVDQQVGNARRHHRGLLQGVVEVIHHVDSFLVKVLHHGFARGSQAGLRVTHGGS